MPTSTPIITSIPVSLISAGDNDRKRFDEVKLQELAASIESSGLLEPPVVRPHGQGYQLIAGERRLRAMTLLGWDEIPVIVRDLTDEEASRAMLAENFHRVDLSPIEEAGAFRKWIDLFGWSVEEVATRANTSPNLVQSRLRLLGLIEDLQFLVNAGELPISYAAWLVPLDANRQRQALRVIRDNPSIGRAEFKAVADELFHQQSVEPLFFLATEEYTAPTVETVDRPVSRAQALSLIGQLGEALAAFDPDHPLLVGVESALVAEVTKKSTAARKAHATRKVQALAA